VINPSLVQMEKKAMRLGMRVARNITVIKARKQKKRRAATESGSAK
jgi:hypothetical protein